MRWVVDCPGTTGNGLLLLTLLREINLNFWKGDRIVLVLYLIKHLNYVACIFLCGEGFIFSVWFLDTGD